MRWISVSIMLLVLAASPARAFDEQGAARAAYEKGEILSLSEIRQSVQSQFNGHIIRTKFRSNSGQRYNYIYIFDVLSDDGGMTRVEVDASNSAVIQVRGQR